MRNLGEEFQMQVMNKYDTTGDLSQLGAANANNMSSSYGGIPQGNPREPTDRIPSQEDLAVTYLDRRSMESHSIVGSKETLGIGSQGSAQTPEPGSPHGRNAKSPEQSRNAGFGNLVAVLGEKKKKHTTPKLPHGGALFSIFYGILVIILGIAFPTREALHGVWLEDYIAAVYLVYMYGVGFLFLVAMEIYLVCLARRHRKRKPSTPGPDSPSHVNTSMDPGFVNLGYESEDKSRHSHNSRSRGMTARELRYSNRSSGALSESTVYEEGDPVHGAENKRETTLYIRIVVIVLGLAAMVYDGLMVKQLHEGLSPSACGRVTIFWPRYVHIAFLLVQCYFLFKHSQMKVLADRAVFRLGFIHVLATNITELIRAFITQTYNGYLYHNTTAISDPSYNSSSVPPCDYEKDIMQRAAPYLYPCVIEYNFLAAALVYFMFSSLDGGDVYYSPNPNDTKPHTEVNCQRTHKGLFFGIVVVAGTTVSVILFFSYMQINNSADISLLIYHVSDIVLHSVLIISVTIAWLQTGRLSYIAQLDLAFEDGVLLIAMSLGILFNVFQLMPTVTELTGGGSTYLYHILSLTANLLAIVTGVYQTSFMIDLSCRYLTLDSEWETKPGRGSVMFLVLANLAIWLLKTFQIRALQLQTDTKEETYGYLPWQLIINGLVPFLTYYYLFSSACLARTWHQIYTDYATVKFDAQYSPRHEKYSTPAKEFEFVRHRNVSRALRMDVDTIVSPVSDV